MLVLWALLAAAVAGCGGQAIGGLGEIPPRGPSDILAASLVRLDAASSFHLKATVGGSVNASALSSLAGGLPIGLLGRLKLDGATVAGDVDLTRRAAHVSASFPTLFGATADVVVVDGAAYTKVSLLGGKYTKSTLPPSPFLAAPAPGAGLDQAVALTMVRAGLTISGATAILVGIDPVEGRPAFHLTLEVPGSGLATILGLIGASSAGAGLTIGPIGYWVYVDTMQPARLTASGSSPAVGNLDVDATIVAYNEPVTITAPQSSQVNGG